MNTWAFPCVKYIKAMQGTEGRYRAERDHCQAVSTEHSWTAVEIDAQLGECEWPLTFAW